MTEAKEMDDSETSKDVGKNTQKEELRSKHDMSSSSCSTCESNTGSGTCSTGSSTLSYKQLKNTQEDDSLEEDSETPTEEYTSGEENGGAEHDVDNANTYVDNEEILMKTKELKHPSIHGSKEIISPKSKEKRIKDYMSAIGTKEIQVTVSSYTTEEKDKVEIFKWKIEQQQLHKDENVNALPSKKEKKSHDDKSGKKKSSKKSEEDIEITKTTVDYDETNKPPEGCEKVPDKEFERIFKGM